MELYYPNAKIIQRLLKRKKKKEKNNYNYYELVLSVKSLGYMMILANEKVNLKPIKVNCKYKSR